MMTLASRLDLLGKRVLEVARQAEMSGRDADARELYVAALRYSRHLWQQPHPAVRQVAERQEAAAMQSLLSWAARQKDTELVRTLRSEVQWTRADFTLNQALAIVWDHQWIERGLQPEPLAGNSKGKMPSMAERLVGWQLPWERWRLERLAVFQTSAHFVALQALPHDLAPNQLAHWHEGVMLTEQKLHFWQMYSSTPFVIRHPVEWAGMAYRQRALDVRLALYQWRAEHGEWPASLDSLAEFVDEGDRVPATMIDSFVYLPEGVPEALNTLPPRTPFLWWQGPNMYMVRNVKGSGGSVSFRDFRRMPSDRAIHRRDLGQPLNSNRDLWEAGVLFPLELQAALPRAEP